MQTHSAQPIQPVAAVVATPTGLPHSQPKTIRVLHVVNGEYYAGAERVQDLLALHLPGVGCEVGFACVKPDQFPDKRHCMDAPLHRCPSGNPFNSQAADQIAAIADDGNYDLLHSHTPRSGWAALSAGQISGRPVVHTMHDVFLSQNRNPMRWALNRYTIGRLRKADFVTTVSPETQRLADRFQLGQQRRMILNGVPHARADFGRSLPKSTWTIGTVGLIRPCKGIEVLIRGMAELSNRNCDVRAVVVGTFYTDDYRDEVMKLVDELGVGNLIEFAGFSSDVPSHLEKFDVFAMPSVGPEGLPMVLIEAMAHGLPTIGSQVPGVGDVVQPGQDGYLFPAGDSAAFADQLEQLVGNQDVWHRMSENAQRRHHNEFSAQRMAGEFAEVYRAAMSGK